MTIKMSQLTDQVFMSLVETDSSVLFVGPPGIGKTSRIEQFGEASGLPVVTIQATGRDSSDVSGFPIPVKDEAGQRVTRYTLSPLVTRIMDTGSERGVLFIDELPQADTLMQKALAPAFFEKRLGDSKIPPGWSVWASGNRVQDRAGVNKMVSHLRNRISIVEVAADQEGWVNWALGQGLHHMITAFARFRPGVVFTNEVPSGDDPYCTPRSLCRSERFLAHRARGSELPTDAVSRAFVTGYIGEAATAELFAFLANHQHLPEPEDILRSPQTAKVPPSEEIGAQFAASALAVSLANPQTAEPVSQYVIRLNRELQVSSFVSIVSRGAGTALNSQTLRAWLTKNAALVSVSMN
jgi:hypothetical protein